MLQFFLYIFGASIFFNLFNTTAYSETCGHLSFHTPKIDLLPHQSPFLKMVYNKIIHLTVKTRNLLCLVILVLHS